MKSYSFGELVELAGVDRNQARRWVDINLIRPGIAAKGGTGHHNRFSFRNVFEAAVAGELFAVGVPTRQVAEAILLLWLEEEPARWDFPGMQAQLEAELKAMGVAVTLSDDGGLVMPAEAKPLLPLAIKEVYRKKWGIARPLRPKVTMAGSEGFAKAEAAVFNEQEERRQPWSEVIDPKKRRRGSLAILRWTPKYSPDLLTSKNDVDWPMPGRTTAVLIDIRSLLEALERKAGDSLVAGAGR